VYTGSCSHEFDDALEAFFSGRMESCEPNEWFSETFDGRKQTATLARLIDALDQPPVG
jgi:hypothetical protein